MPQGNCLRLGPMEDNAHIRQAWRREIGAQLKAARERRKESQTQVARWAGIQQQLLSKIESGEANPTIETIGVILSALGFTLRVTDVD